MSDYTAEDFAKARFAIASTRTPTKACRNSSTGVWHMDTGDVCLDSQMARSGFWEPVIDRPELTIDTLHEAWEGAEVITADNLPRGGDTLIGQINSNDYSVWSTGYGWDTGHTLTNYRILQRRPRRREGAEELETLIRQLPDSDAAAQADWLIEHGVRVVDSA